MHDAKPVLTILVLCGVGLFWLALAWVGTGKVRRLQRLEHLAVVEDAVTLPPVKLRDQARWLAEHRLARLQGVSILLGLSALVGLGEGLACRRRDLQAGMGLWRWTLGLLSAALTPGILGGLVLCPVPWSVLPIAIGGAVWSGITLFLVSRGRPAIA